MAATVNLVSDGVFSQYLESRAAALEDYLEFEYGQITVLTGENHAAVDRFSESTGLVVTVFRLEGDEYIRESTSIRDESDERATGTSASLLERNDKVMDVLQSLSAIAQENAAGTEEASASVEELSASSEQVAAATGQMSAVASDLQDKIQQFRL